MSGRNPMGDIHNQWFENEGTWKGYVYTPAARMVLLAEEVGEIARALQCRDGAYQWPPAYSPEAYDEIVDAAAVLVAMAFECAKELDL